MKRVTRRTFLKTTTVASAAAAFSARSWSQVVGANDAVRLAIAGLNGRGKELAAQFPQIPGVQVVALCANNKVDLAKTPARLGAPLSFDPPSEQFTGENRVAANQYRRRKEYRAPWIVPELV